MTVYKFTRKLPSLKGLFVISFKFNFRYRELNLWIKPYKNGHLCSVCKRPCCIVHTLDTPRTWRDITPAIKYL